MGGEKGILKIWTSDDENMRPKIKQTVYLKNKKKSNKEFYVGMQVANEFTPHSPTSCEHKTVAYQQTKQAFLPINYHF